MIRRRPPEDAAETSEDTLKGFDSFELRLGDIMRGERATLGKSLLDVQRELKIRATYIAAIENADPTAFETPGFVAGYVRSYARYLGLDPEWAYRRFREEGRFTTVSGLETAAANKARESRNGSDRRDPLADPNALFVPRGEAFLAQLEPGAIGSVFVLLALIFALGYGGWSVLKEIQQVKLAPLEDQPGLLADVAPLAPSVQAAGGDAPVTPPSVEALDRLYRPQALDRPVLAARDGPIATLDPGEIGVLVGERPIPQKPVSPDRQQRQVADAIEAGLAEALGMAPVQVVVEDEAPELAIVAVRPAWVRVTAADGTVLFEKILDAGERYVVPETEEPATLRAGNSGSVYFAIAGVTYGPSAPGAQIARNVVLSPDALRERYQLADLGADPDLALVLAQAEDGADEGGTGSQ